MKSKRPALLRKGLTASAVAGLGLGLLTTVGAGPASAVPVSVSLDYTCTYPLIGARDLKVNISSDIPTQVGVNQPLPDVWVDTNDAISSDTTEGLQAIGATSLEGKAIADVQLHAPEFNGGVEDLPNINQVLENVKVPASGAFNIRSTGKVVTPTFSQVEHVSVTVGNLTLKVTAKKADGSPTALGTFNVPCVQTPGQNNVLAQADIVDHDVNNPPVNHPYPPSWPITTDPVSLGAGYPTSKLHYDLNLNGSSFIKGANGTLPIIGKIGVDVDGATGAITGPLTLNPGKGTFKILGFLPVTSDISFTQQGDTTGSYSDGQINTTSKMVVNFANFNVFGAIPIAGGSSCSTSSPISVAMNSNPAPSGTNPFNPYVGGPFNAPGYTLPALNGNCGPLGGIVSIFEQGSGNTITAALTPQ